jgi:glycosyltransferase involved in cell wall biosynthesis
MCSSKPVIGIINGEAKDIILKANCGIILDSTKIDESTDKIIEMVKFDDKKIDSLGKNGKKYYDNLFNSRLRKNQILELIK